MAVDACDRLTLSVNASVSGSVGKDATETAIASCSISPTQAIAFSFGTGTGQCDQVWSDQRSLAPSASERLDISNDNQGTHVALTNPFGDVVDFTKIAGIFIRNTSSAASISVGGDSTYDLTTLFGANGDKVNIGPGGYMLISQGNSGSTYYAVAGSEVLQINNNDGTYTANYEITIWGVSA